MHGYNESDRDVFWCDECDNEIIGSVFSISGREYNNKNIARSLRNHYHKDCIHEEGI